MPTLPELETQSPETLYKFLRWLAFGLGRYVGIETTPHNASGDTCDRIFALAQHFLAAPRRISDSDLGISPPLIRDDASIADVVTALSDYMFDRQVAVYTDAADFHPDHARDLQRDALARSVVKRAQ